jgi:hypothetical protein
MADPTTKKKGTKKFVYLILVLFLILLCFVPTMIWNLLPEHPLNVWILDKTVPTTTYREHRGLMWVLNFFKVENHLPKKPFYYNKDYYGFFPITRDKWTANDLNNAKPPNPDLIYITDTYGVYDNDYWVYNKDGRRSPKIYAGLSSNDNFIVKKNLKNKMTFIAEWNTFNTPTTEENRSQLESVLGVTWKQWMGRYFIDLRRGKEVAEWMIDNYEKQYKEKWNFKGAGYVLCSNWDEIIVMEHEKDFDDDDIKITIDPKYQKEFQIDHPVHYYYWFDFIEPSPDTEVIAWYDWNLTEPGLAKIGKIGLGKHFPAIVRKKTSDYTSYYFAGDFADHEATPSVYKFAGLDKLRYFFNLDIKGEANYFYWKMYVPVMRKIIHDVFNVRKDIQIPKKEVETDKKGEIKLVSRTQNKSLQIYENKTWKNFFVKGVNMGMAVPGKFFTEFPSSVTQYSNWFKQIGDMNVNTIRVYTLMHPSFYQALYFYNQENPKKPLWLLQGIWPEENPPNGNYLSQSYREAFLKEIQYGVDSIHGNVTIPERKGRAYGTYVADVSPFTLGFLVGRELEAVEVVCDDKINKGYKYEGTYFSTEPQATPTEGWLAWACDNVVLHEEKNYSWTRPVSIVSWPTMDPTVHESEWDNINEKSSQFNDLTTININHIKTNAALIGGFFGSYHIYPNYPDFMNNELSYKNYRDAQGEFMYGGYLKEFMAAHTKYPALVAEFGLANGMSNVHTNPDGYNHGAISEEFQGAGTIRMMKAIQREGFAGGVIFEWMDEWAKKTWTTEPFMIPYERHVLWHNAIDPEQNYGILAYESLEKLEPDMVLEDNKGEISKIELRSNETYLYIDLFSISPLSFTNQNLLIGLDTYDRARGQFKYSPSIPTPAPSGIEFLINLSAKGPGRFLAAPSYNMGNMKFSSLRSLTGIFENIRLLTNKARITKTGRKIDAIYEDASLMRYGSFEGTNNQWIQDGNHIRIRIPWGRLMVSDPSSLRVIDDPRLMNYYPSPIEEGVPCGKTSEDQNKNKITEFKTTTTKGFIITALLQDKNSKNVIDVFPGDKNIEMPPTFQWSGWEVPHYRERLKKSYPILQKFLATFAN